MNDLCERPRNRGVFSYLGAIKNTRPYYLHEYDNTVDHDKEDDGVCIIRKGTLLHCFYDGDCTVYFLNTKGLICMRSHYWTTHEFYMDYALTPKGNNN